ncbi:hypothetical protein BC777_3603 [Yoonia maricola]|uniref:Outer membrane protein n=1 Tax=Yoonia maricola TaxID=420999 RepID=A0A2M8W0T4_9RHOB|nr:Lpg1974 family pore-forming outer membrane protein [Yoonia maricola]PJI84542.1 hypothetical protein BC777_3603 [Yoonia maricola]
MTKFTSASLITCILTSTASVATADEISIEIQAPSISAAFANQDGIGAETSARISADYTFETNAGFRLGVWDMDLSDNEGQGGAPTELSFRQVDFVGFSKFDATPELSLEFLIGLRALGLNDQNFTSEGRETNFDGVGGVFGVNGAHTIIPGGAIYGNFETAVLFGDGDTTAVGEATAENARSDLSQTTIGFGYEHDFALGDRSTTLSIGYEATVLSGLEDPTDVTVGFDGVVLGASVTF